MVTCIKLGKKLTLIKIVLDNVLDVALLSDINSLVLQVLAFSAHAVGGIHAFLELIILPAKHVVTMLAQSCVVTIAEIERVGVTSLPL